MKIVRPALGLVSFAVLAGTASAQTWPARPVRVLAGFAPGGGTPGQFEAFAKAEVAKYARLVKDAHITLD